MTSPGSTRSLLLGTGAALLALGALMGCTPTTEKDAPATSTPTTPTTQTTPTTGSTAPAVTPTEKAVGGNSFSPSVNPTGPGAICKEVVNGVCVR